MSHPTVEGDVPNRWMLSEKPDEQVRALVSDAIVSATLSGASGNHVPDSDAPLQQARRPLGVWRRSVDPEKRFHHGPEVVLRVAVVLLLGE
jgi:hypothetical protein